MRRILGLGVGLVGLRLGGRLAGGLRLLFPSLGTRGRGRRKLLRGGRLGSRPRSFLPGVLGLRGPLLRSRRVLRGRLGGRVSIP